ncbi:bacillopeptidase F [Fictibacillus barbaricus]|nr:bacillopeptidase F [Fictibacillus barbaricus]
MTFLIKLKEQANTLEAAKEADVKAKKQKLSSYKTKLNKRSAVVSSLRAKAIETQTNLKQYLDEQKKLGHAKDIRSYYIVNGMSVTATKEVMEKVASFPEVEKVLPNEIRQLHPVIEKAIPSKEPTKAIKEMTDNNIEWNLESVHAPQVWEMGIDGTGTVIANIDTGVQWDHPALKTKYRGYDGSTGSVSHEYNWFDATAGETAPYDDLAHGTHTMGTMVGSEPDGSNRIGVAPGAKWMAVKAFTNEGGTDTNLLSAGEWILAPTDANGNPHPEKAPDVVNNSWGGGPGLDDWYREMVQNWRAADIFPAFAAGNGLDQAPGTIANPANYPESFAVGATDSDDKLAYFSLVGPSPYGGILKPEITAPGVNVRSSVPGGGYEGGWNGTSMATPHVAAVVSMLRQVNANLTVEEIDEILKKSAIPLTDSRFLESPNNGYGYGLINAYDAVSSITIGLGTIKGTILKQGIDNEIPTYTHESPKETYADMDTPLSITTKDNISIQSVFLEYQDKDGKPVSVEAQRTSGNYVDGTYSAVLPGNVIGIPSVSYRWRIIDYGQNEVITDTYNINVIPGVTIGYSTDFESQPNGWKSWGTLSTWEWGQPISGPGHAASGEKVYATNLEGNYDNSANMSLMMPAIDLGAGTAFLQFKHWYDIGYSFDNDYAQVFVSTDQHNWEEKARFTDQSNGWLDAQVDLSTYANKRIYIMFNFISDQYQQKPGWYLDDVKLSASSNGTNITDMLIDTGKSNKPNNPEEKPVNPHRIQSINHFDSKNINQSAPVGLPLPAEISVLETGRSVKTSLQNGTYSLTHSVGDYTLVAEAYGYRPAQKSVKVPNGEIVENFVLEALPKGTITGKVIDKRTGGPIANATLLLMEDAVVQPVQTDNRGRYQLTAFEGTYTLKVMASGYVSQEIEVSVTGSKIANKDFSLKPFITMPGEEIGYDDGTMESARAFETAGNALGVKMSLPQGKKQALVTGGLYKFFGNDWPYPGGTEIQVAVYDASGPDGLPGKKLAGPIDATALRNGEWTKIDLSKYGIQVYGDFYLVYIQSVNYPHAPGLGYDANGTNAERSWEFFDGSWRLADVEEGNYMIRALLDYELPSPVITSPTDGFITNQDTAKIEGETTPNMKVTVLRDGKLAGTTTSDQSGNFFVNVELKQGTNKLTAIVTTDRGSTDESAPVTVIYNKKSQ